MLAVDSSTFIEFLRGMQGVDVDCLKQGEPDVVFPPVVVSELLSHPHLEQEHRNLIVSAPLLSVATGYWERAGLMRSRLLARGLKPKLPDTLIAQSCIDHKVPLLTRDSGFEPFEKHCGLKLYKAL